VYAQALRLRGHGLREVRNPLTAALAAMALHALAGLAFGWAFPSIATFLAAGLAIGWASVAPKQPPKAIGGIAAATVLIPSVVPLPILLAALAAFAVILLPVGPDPLTNVAVALPSLTFLVLLLSL